MLAIIATPLRDSDNTVTITDSVQIYAIKDGLQIQLANPDRTIVISKQTIKELQTLLDNLA